MDKLSPVTLSWLGYQTFPQELTFVVIVAYMVAYVPNPESLYLYIHMNHINFVHSTYLCTSFELLCRFVPTEKSHFVSDDDTLHPLRL